MLMQVCAQVMGNDMTITVSATHGNFELNVMMPVIARNLLESIALLGSGSETFAKKCVTGLSANAARCERNIEESLAMCTALAPVIGYDKAAEIAKEAHRSARTVREVAREKAGLNEAELNRALDPKRQAG
jgi:fumarate hydratase, class II